MTAYDVEVRNLRSGPKLWLFAFVGFFLLHTAWGLAMPYDAPPDEESHALHAVAVAHGEWLPSPVDDRVEVPASLYRSACFEQNVDIPANCQTAPGGDQHQMRALVTASFYNPVYYLVTGWPLAVWPTWKGILLARMLTGAAMAALLASAVVAGSRWTRHRAIVPGLVVAITPMTAHLGGAVNPNGIEIAAGVALFAALIPLFHEPSERVNRAAVALAGISACVLVTPRPLGIMWLGLIVVVCLIAARRARLRSLFRGRAVRWWLGGAAVSIAAALAWTLVARPLQVPSDHEPIGLHEIVRQAVLNVWPNIVDQMVGVTGWSEVLQPRLIYVVWFMALGLLVLGGFVLGARVDKVRLTLLLLGTFVPLLGEEMLMVNSSGWFNQGRYFLAGAVGLPMLGAYALARNGLPATKIRSLTRTLAALLLPVHWVCLAYTMCRYESGLQIMNPLKGSWMPPLGPVLPLVAGAVAVLLLFAVYWSASRVPSEPAEALPEPAEALPEPATSVEDAPTVAVLASTP